MTDAEMTTERTSRIQPAWTVELHRDRFEVIAKAHAWDSNVAVAKAIGISPRQVARVLDGTTAPGVAFIAGLLAAAPETGFRRMFEIVPATDVTGEEVI
jgi:hypothetical protein